MFIVILVWAWLFKYAEKCLDHLAPSSNNPKCQATASLSRPRLLIWALCVPRTLSGEVVSLTPKPQACARQINNPPSGFTTSHSKRWGQTSGGGWGDLLRTRYSLRCSVRVEEMKTPLPRLARLSFKGYKSVCVLWLDTSSVSPAWGIVAVS